MTAYMHAKISMSLIKMNVDDGSSFFSFNKLLLVLTFDVLVVMR